MSLLLFRDRLALIDKQRRGLDEDFAQILAEGLIAGHSIVDLLDGPPKPTQNKQKVFDL